jgi:hypothetical protein
MIMSPAGLGPENYCVYDGQQQLETTDPSSRQIGRPVSTNPQLSDSNTDLVLDLDGCLTPKQTGLLTVGYTITLTFSYCSMLMQNTQIKKMRNKYVCKTFQIAQQQYTDFRVCVFNVGLLARSQYVAGRSATWQLRQSFPQA